MNWMRFAVNVSFMILADAFC